MNHQDGGLSDVSIKRGTDRENVSTVVAALVELGAEWITVRRPKHRVREGALYGEFIVTGTVGAEVLEGRDHHTDTRSDPQTGGGSWFDEEAYQSDFRGLRIASNPVLAEPDTQEKDLPDYPPTVRCGDYVRFIQMGYAELVEGFVRRHDSQDPPGYMTLGEHPKNAGITDLLTDVHSIGDVEVLNPEPLSGISAVWEAMLARREEGLDECLGL